MDVRFTLAGLVVGTLVGVCGIGGSALLAPILILFLGVNPIIAVGTDLVYSVPTKLVAAFMHRRQGTVDKRIVLLLIAGGAPGAGIGLALTAFLRAHVSFARLNTEIKHAIGFAILLACAAAIAAYALRRGGDATGAGAKRASAPFKPASSAGLVATGALVGVLVAITSVGSGSVTLPLLIFLLPGISLRRLIGSEIAFGALLVPLAALGHSTLGDVDWSASSSLLLGSVPGAVIGSRLSAVVKDTWLRPVIIGVLALAGSRLV
ncbi:MAG: sulfite exporter TauE/SafE family protein [Candidatus Eremiobacteraeota bacterium]|nr:sulfite exporter TauE/SafE family protein [Candidatus Eremiobacteraeota bacterium]